MANNKNVSKKGKVQYYKVVNTRHGHHGVFYKVGLNVDPVPVPLNQLGSCERGAIYFCDAEHLEDWFHVGDSIAWVTPVGRMQQDGNKYRAHKIMVTKILPISEAVKLIKGFSPSALEYYGIELTTKDVLSSRSFSETQKFEWLYENDENAAMSFLIARKSNKKFLEFVRTQDLTTWHRVSTLPLLEAGLIDVLDPYDLRELLACKRNRPKMKAALKKYPERFIDVLISLAEAL